jgi:hypothetical protein
MLAEVVLTLALTPAQEPTCRAATSATRSVELSWMDPFDMVKLRALPSSHDWKQFYVNWLKTRYAYNIERLNKAYGLESTSFTDLTESDFKTLDRKLEAVQKDDREFWPEFEAYLAAAVKDVCPAAVAKVAWKRKRT